MPGMAYKIAHKRVLVVEEMVEQCRADHHQAGLASDVEELVKETADLLGPITRALAFFDAGPDPDAGPDQFVAAHMAGFLMTKALSLFPKVGDLVSDVRRLGYAVDGMDRFEQARDELTRLRGEFATRWMLPDEANVKAARQAAAAGKCRVL